MELKDIMEEVRTLPTVPVWPHAAKVLGISRGAAYDATRTGDIGTIRIGRSIRVLTAPLRQRLRID
jgi:hypothetical protein